MMYTQTGKTKETCLKKIYDEYGKDNVRLLSIQNIKEPVLWGLMSKDAVSVVFTVSDEPKKVAVPKPVLDKIDKLNETKPAAKPQAVKPAMTTIPPMMPDPAQAAAELDRQRLEMLETSISRLAEVVANQGFKQTVDEPPAFKKARAYLQQNGFSAEFITDALLHAKKSLVLADEDNAEKVQQFVLNYIKDSVKIYPVDLTPFQSSNTAERLGLVFCLVGPTGVGKTTTVAKLCAYYYLVLASTLKKKIEVGVITTDNYKVGAYDQIQRYCSIMKLPLTVVVSQDELTDAIARAKKNYDVVLIDTVGRGPNDKENISTIVNLFKNTFDSVTFYLTVAATSQTADIENIIKAYRDFNCKALIVTKMDETVCVGGAVSALAKTKVPVAYLTTGQTPPDDLEPATVDCFLKKLIGFENLHE